MKSGIDLRGIFLLFREKFKTILLVVFFFTMSGGLISLTFPSVYEAQIDILVDYPSISKPTSSTPMGEIEMSLQLIETYKYLLKSKYIFLKLNEMIDQPLVLTEFQSKVKIQSNRDTPIISILVHDDSPKKAVLLANNIALIFQKEMKTLMKLDNVSVLNKSSAIGDTNLITPPTKFYLIVSFFIGILVFIMCTILKESFFAILNNQEKVNKILNLSNLGSIPHSKYSRKNRKRKRNREVKLLSDFRSDEDFPESFRTIRVILFHIMKQQNAKSILVTSSVSKEGKSLISGNIAVIMAMGNKKTIFIDADLRRPSGRELFKIPSQIGLTSFIEGHSTIENIIQKTDIRNLFFIGSGPIPPKPIEVLTSFELKILINQLKKDFDVIIIDSSPLVVSDAVNLANVVDGCIFVINSHKTRIEHAKESVKQLRNVKMNLLGSILNKGNEEKVYTNYYK